MSDDAGLRPLGSGPEKSGPGDAELLHPTKQRRADEISHRTPSLSCFPTTNIHHHHLIMTTSLDLLKQTGTVVVSDSGDFECAYSSTFIPACSI
jgi:hypothetical protein